MIDNKSSRPIIFENEFWALRNESTIFARKSNFCRPYTRLASITFSLKTCHSILLFVNFSLTQFPVSSLFTLSGLPPGEYTASDQLKRKLSLKKQIYFRMTQKFQYQFEAIVFVKSIRGLSH